MSKVSEMMAKLFSKRNTMILLFVFVIICLGFYLYSNSKFNIKDAMGGGNSSASVAPSSSTENSTSGAAAASTTTIPSGYDSRPTATPNDLLPKDVNREWANLNPVGTGGNVVGGDLLNAQSFMGQISQYKGIMNYDIRAFPVIEKREVSPWLQSTYEPDINKTGIQCTN